MLLTILRSFIVGIRSEIRNLRRAIPAKNDQITLVRQTNVNHPVKTSFLSQNPQPSHPDLKYQFPFGTERNKCDFKVRNFTL